MRNLREPQDEFALETDFEVELEELEGEDLDGDVEQLVAAVRAARFSGA